MNLAGNPLPYNSSMRAAYKAAGVPLWVTPHEAADSLLYQRWSEQIAFELGEWFARMWSMAFAAGYRGLKPFAPDREHILRMLSKMGYANGRASELASFLLDDIDGFHRKGCARRHLKP